MQVISTVNSQITDAVTQADALDIGIAPSMSMSMTYTVMAQTMGMVMHNGAAAQHGMQQIAEASTAVTCALIIAKGAASS